MHKSSSHDMENKQLVDWILSDDESAMKQASTTASVATRTSIKEDSFQRVIIPYDDIGNEDLDYNGESEIPGKWYELEADTRGARIVPYNSSPITVTYRAEKYLVVISQMITEEYTKNINELRGYKTDVRAAIQDSAMRDLHTCEDTFLINTVNRACGATPIDLSSLSWTMEKQYVNMQGAFTRAILARMQSFLTDRGLPQHVNLCNLHTANRFLAWHHDEVGGTRAQEILDKGLKGNDRFSFFQTEWIATIKNGIVSNGMIYQFTHPDYLGHACRLEDIKVTIKKDYDIVKMRADQQVGLTFGVSRGLQRNVLALGTN